MSASGPSGPLVLFNLIILNGVNYPNIVFMTRCFFSILRVGSCSQNGEKNCREC